MESNNGISQIGFIISKNKETWLEWFFTETCSMDIII